MRAFEYNKRDGDLLLVCLPVCPSTCLSTHLPACLSVCLSVCLLIFTLSYLFVLSTCLSIGLSVSHQASVAVGMMSVKGSISSTAPNACRQEKGKKRGKINSSWRNIHGNNTSNRNISAAAPEAPAPPVTTTATTTSKTRLMVAQATCCGESRQKHEPKAKSILHRQPSPVIGRCDTIRYCAMRCDAMGCDAKRLTPLTALKGCPLLPRRSR